MKRGEFKKGFNKVVNTTGTIAKYGLAVVDPMTYVVLAGYGVKYSVDFTVDHIDNYLSIPPNISNQTIQPEQEVELCGEEFYIIPKD